MHDAAFHDAEIVRWIEWAAAGYFRITSASPSCCSGVAVTRSRALPRWSALLALLAGFAFIADRIAVGTDGFTGGVPQPAARAAFIFFAVVATIAAWWRDRGDRPTGTHQPRIGFPATDLTTTAAQLARVWSPKGRGSGSMRPVPSVPQKWAAVPAAVLGVGGAALLVLTPSSATLDALGWVWPPALLGLLVWITTRIRRQLPRRGGRWMLYPVIAVAAIAAVGGGIHTVTQSIQQTSAETLPGQLIDVGDHRLYLSCTGSGEPTVILEPGLGETSAAWGWIAPSVAVHTRVCIYDRAGRGRSEPSPDPQDGDQTATDLHTLLERADITGPLVMVGHSLGGLYALDYVARYPRQVAGMVLLDATPPTAFTALPDYPSFYNMYRVATGLFPGLARFGVTQLIYSASHPELPAQTREQARAALSTAGQARSQRDEFAMVPTMMAQARAVTDLGDLPLYVLTAPVGAQTGWLTPQMDMAALSDNSIHLFVAGASHQSLLDNQADAAIASKATTQVVDAARTGTPLK